MDEKILGLYKKYVENIYIHIRVALSFTLKRIGICEKMKTVIQQNFLEGKEDKAFQRDYDVITGGAMGKIIKDTIHANGIDIGIYTQDFENEFISLTDIARYKSDDPTAVIQNWMRNRDVIEFLGLWERLHNPDFKPLEFERFKKRAGANAFTMSPKKWIGATDAIGIVLKAGRYGGTYAQCSFV